MTSISALYSALSGLDAQRKVMDLTAHNVANATTPGYHRQAATLQAVGTNTPGVFAGRDTRNYGVKVVGTTRSFDELAEARSVREEAGRSATELTSSTLDQLQAMIPEPSDSGIASQLDAFWGAWSELANQPDGTAQRTELLAKAGSLTTSLHRAASDLTSLKDTAATQMDSLATAANGLATQIAGLNKAIAADPTSSLDLADQRDQLVLSLSKLTGAESRPTANGQIDVYVNGRAIVSATQSYAVQSVSGVLQWAKGGQPVSPSSGQAAALTATISDIVPRYTAALDKVAAGLVTSVNTLHAAGYDQAGGTGHMFFDPTKVTAADITLSADVATNPANIAAGAPVLPGPTAPGALDGEQARAIANLADAATGPDSDYRALIGGLAVETGAAARRADLQAQVADTARTQADSVGAVSLDEEMANLTQAQRAFEASSRVITALDDMLGFLIERTGVVGR